MITDQRTYGTGHIVTAWIVTALTLGYTLPWAIATARGKATAGVIAAVSVLAGWTVVGWWVALFMALTPHRIVAAAPMQLAYWNYPPPALPPSSRG